MNEYYVCILTIFAFIYKKKCVDDSERQLSENNIEVKMKKILLIFLFALLSKVAVEVRTFK